MDWQAMMDAGGTKSVGGFISSYFETKAANKVRAAQNRNARITGARNAGILSQHEAQVREETMSARMKIQRSRNEARAAAKANAAFAGVSGGSVNATSFQISRSAAERIDGNQRRAESELSSIQEKKYQNDVNAALGQQGMLSGPSFLGLALGLAGSHYKAQADDTGSGGIDGTQETTSKSGAWFNLL